jgi:hypothetical protein
MRERDVDRQIINRFCQGLYDKEAGERASNQRHATLEKVMDAVRWFQYNHEVMYPAQATTQKETKPRERASVAAIQETSPVTSDSSSVKLLESLNTNLMLEMQKITAALSSMSAGQGRGRGRGRGRCFRCGNQGHYRVQCPLNEEGLSPVAVTQPKKET